MCTIHDEKIRIIYKVSQEEAEQIFAIRKRIKDKCCCATRSANILCDTIRNLTAETIKA